MSSRGLRVLTVSRRQAEAANLAITLAAPNDVMREILAISRYDKLFHISDSVDTGR
jgi:anti-anti-sigma factor